MMPKIEGIEEDELRYLHDTAKMTQQAIADYYEVSRTTIFDRMKEYKIQPRSLSEALIGNTNGYNCRTYSVNKDFFKTWTPESAWMFGWALGDGGYTDQYMLRFRLARIDKEVLYKFRTVLDSEHPVKDFDEWRKQYQKWCYGSRIDFHSKELVNDIKQLKYEAVPYG